MTIETIDHVSVGQERATSTFHNKENFLALLEIFLNKSQDIEDAFIELANSKDLSSVTGVWLDYIGSIIGEDRDGLEDEPYRSQLQLRIAINTSDGTTNSVRDIVKNYTNSESVRIAEALYSYGQIIFDGEDNATSNLDEVVSDITPVATKLLVAQNTNVECVLPAWEISTVDVDLFYVDIEGVEDVLKLSLSPETDPSSFYISTDGGENVLDEDTDDVCYLGWETSATFVLSSRENFEVSLDGITSEVFYLSGVSDEIEGDSLLPWEINSTTNSVDVPWYDYLLEEYDDVEDIDSVFVSLEEVVENLPEA